MNKEIERKWLVKKLHKVILATALEVAELEQFYTVVSDDFEERLRKSTVNGITTYTCTTKQGNGLTREEEEHESDQAAWDSVIDLRQGKLIKKTRYKLDLNGYIGELDLYEEPAGLCTLEIEFPSEYEAKSFTIDRFNALGEVIEVTGDKTYSNKNLALA
jgi:CYTH domain-containing protein